MAENDHPPEYVAYLLFQILADIESKELRRGYPNTADRNWVLDTYAECLDTVRNPKNRVEAFKSRA
jgi:hypothetical protein